MDFFTKDNDLNRSQRSMNLLSTKNLQELSGDEARGSPPHSEHLTLTRSTLIKILYSGIAYYCTDSS